jgi:hypothetical protein
MTNATYFDNVRVPVENLVGPENGGWGLITGQLNLERITLAMPGPSSRLFDAVRQWSTETEAPEGGRMIDLPIGAYQDKDPSRTVFVSTHLIAEFEGLIDRFTIIDGGREVLTLGADEARERYQKIYARFAGAPPPIELEGARVLRRTEREIEIVVHADAAQAVERVQALSPEVVKTEALTLEDIFVATVHTPGVAA